MWACVGAVAGSPRRSEGGGLWFLSFFVIHGTRESQTGAVGSVNRREGFGGVRPRGLVVETDLLRSHGFVIAEGAGALGAPIIKVRFQRSRVH